MRVSSMVAAAVMLFLFATPVLFAENFVAINSVDGRDVLSGIFYANVKGYPVRFMPYPGGNSELFAIKVGNDHSVLLIQSAGNPASGLAEADLKARGNTVEIYSSSNGMLTNIDLAKKSGAQSFIIVDSAYSDSAISVIQYAMLTKSYVIFADSTNLEQVKSIVAGKTVTIYGFVDSKVKSELSSFSPSYIGKGEDKYDDNVEIVKKTLAEFGGNRAIITDGSYIEDSMVPGEMPILLTGGRLVPEVTYNFIKENVKTGQLKSLMLIGSDLVYPMYDMRERVKNDLADEGVAANFGVVIKFAQAVPSQGGSALALDTFRMPSYKPSLKITEIVYNSQTKKVMLGVENTGEGPLYFNYELKVKVNGVDFKTFSESSPRLVELGNSVGLEYDLDISSVPDGTISATVLVKYGSGIKSLEEFVTSEGNLASITYADITNVSVKLAKYDKAKQIFSVTIKNDGDQTAYVFTKLLLKDESGANVKVSAATIREIDPSSIYVEEFPLIFSDKEIELNKEVPVTLEYGGRRGFLVKSSTYMMLLEQPQSEQLQPIFLGVLTVGVILLVVLVILWALYTFVVKKKQ